MNVVVSRMKALLKKRFAFIILLVFGALLTYLARIDSFAYNENGRLASGVIYLQTGDYSAFHVNPPLVSLIGAVPAALCGAERPTRAELGITRFGRDEYRAGNFFVSKNPNFLRCLFWGRLFCVVLVTLGLWASYRFARSIFGGASSVIYLLLGAFTPQILGMGALIVPDVASAFLGAVSVFLFWRWLRSPDKDNMFLAGIALGFAELTKFTLLIFYPLFAALFLIYWASFKKSETHPPFGRSLARLAAIFALSLLVINFGYGFEGTGKQLRSFKFQTVMFSGCKTLKDVPRDGANRFDGSGNLLETALGYLPAPLPKNFIQGIDTQRLDFERGLSSYLRGQWSEHGWPHYYLYALLVKTPVGTLLLFALAIFCSVFLKGYNAPFRDEAVVLLPGAVLLAFVSSQSGFSVHARYILPALPFFFIWTSKLGRAFVFQPSVEDEPNNRLAAPQGYKTVRVLTILLLAWSLWSSLSVYPYSISYFNELAAILPTPKVDDRPQIPQLQPPRDLRSQYKSLVFAGVRNGPRHLLDSNVDWGQNLYSLERWLQRRPEIDKIKVVYDSCTPIESTSIPTDANKFFELTPGWYAVGVNELFSEEQDFRFFLDCAPVDFVAGSIYIYYLKQDDVERLKKKKTK